MKWMTAKEIADCVPLPNGYRFELLRRGDIAEVVAFIRSWFPGITVGSASGYTRAEFFEDQVSLAGEAEKNVCVVLLKRNLELAGLVCCERDQEALTLYGSLIVIAPAHRGAQLGWTGVVLMETLARNMGFGLVYGMATLKYPHMQRALESAGWQLIGITPGYDREMIAPGIVKRVYEAMYAKVLDPDTSLLRPEPQNLTARAREFFDFVFPGEGVGRLSAAEASLDRDNRR
jgi:hypothetical protein